MARRGNVPIDPIWVLLNLTHRRADQVLSSAQSRAVQRLPKTVLSVNRNVTNTQALVKIVGTPADFAAALPSNTRSAIIRTFTEADHVEALALVTTVEWTGEPEEE